MNPARARSFGDRLKRPAAAADARLVRERLRDSVVLVAAVLWMVAGLSLLVLLLPHIERPSLDAGAFTLGCIALGLLFSAARSEFRIGRQQLAVAPDTGFHVLAAVVLAPPIAALVGGLAVLRAIRTSGTRVEQSFLAASSALATGTASIVAHEALGAGVPAGREVLAAALLAASTRAVVMLAGQLLFAELRGAGGALLVLRSLPVLAIFLLEAGLPILVVAMSAPFLGQPLLALAVVFAGQLVTWQVLRMQHAHFRGARVTDELLDTFHRYVPAHVAQRVLADDARGATATGGEQREVTVMFIDIRGFTSWSERTAPSEVLAELNRLLGELADSILATDGTLDKFTGDGLMAFWNAPSDQPDHAARAVQCLPKLLMRVREFNLRREAQRAAPLEIGIGIATGPAMLGNIGHRNRLSYTAIGDTVNLAARLEKATRDHGVAALLDEGTFLALPMSIQRQLMRLDAIEVKGRRDRVRLYAPVALVRHRSSDTRADGVA